MQDASNNNQNVVKKVSIIGVTLNFILLCLKLFIGLISRSQAMIADGVNSAGDIFASFMSYVGAKLSSKPNDEDHPYGHGKAEYLFSQFIITKLCLYIYTRLQYKRYNSILIKASMEDHRNDIVITLGTIIGIISSLFGIYFIDGIVGILISIWIGLVGIKLLKESYGVLMDTSISKEEQENIISMSKKYPDILHVDSIVSKPIGNSYIIILKISMDGEKTLGYCHMISGKLKEDIINKFDYVHDVIIHINPH